MKTRGAINLSKALYEYPTVDVRQNEDFEVTLMGVKVANEGERIDLLRSLLFANQESIGAGWCVDPAQLPSFPRSTHTFGFDIF